MDPKWTKVIAVVIVVVLVGAGATFYYLRTKAAGNNCTLAAKNPLVVDQAEVPDSPDPAVTFSTPGWALVQQIYQGMVNYNGTSYTTFEPVLASSWATSTDHFQWTFNLRSGAHFSNGDPYNAYVEWFSLYRTLVMNQAPTFILTENFWYPNLNYTSAPPGSPQAVSAIANVTTDLNTFNFASPTPSQRAVMENPNQSFQVVNNLTIRLNVGNGYLGHVPYSYILAALSAPTAYAVDPTVIQAHGGVTNATNDWMGLHPLGTGPYTLVNAFSTTASGYELTPDPNYWGAAAAAQSPSINLLQPAKAKVDVIFQSQPQITVQDLKAGQASMASFAYLGPTTVQQLQSLSCVVVQALPVVFGATSGSWWIYMNQSTYPFNNLSVRQAVVHAIDYQSIINLAFGGAASQWVGPVPPGYPYYNPQNLTPYQFNLTLALQEIGNSPCKNGACAGTTLNYEYLNLGDWQSVATILKADLAKIGLTINPVGISLQQLYAEQTIDPNTGQCTAQESSAGLGPFPIGQEFYTSDYISPDDWTQNNAISTGSANMCMAGYSNATVDRLVLQAAGTSDPTLLNQYYTQMTSAMYNNYTDAWLVVPTQYAVYNSLLHGFIENPMASGEPFALSFNTQYA